MWKTSLPPPECQPPSFQLSESRDSLIASSGNDGFVARLTACGQCVLLVGLGVYFVDRGGKPSYWRGAGPRPDSEFVYDQGTTPASEQAIAARRAAGPEPMTTTSLDSIFQSRQRSQSQERDASSSTLQNHSATDIAILLTATAASNIFSVAPSGLNPE